MRKERRQKKHVCSVLLLSILLVCQLSIVSCNESSVETYPEYTGDNWYLPSDSDAESSDSAVADSEETIDLVQPDIPDGTEYIELANEEDIYALGRLLALKATKTNILGSDYDINNDFAKFVFPEDIADNDAKINYVASSSYKLTKDMTLDLQKENGATFFLGIGSTDYPFSGVFNGYGKTITLRSDGEISLNENTNHQIGLFGNIDNALIVNTNVKIESDVLVNKCTNVVKIGALIGGMSNSIVDNCSAMISNAYLGVNYGEGETNVNQTFVGGLVGYSNLSDIQNCRVTLTDGTLYAKGYDVSSSALYGNFSVGGFLGYSSAGSDNVTNIGRVGSQVLNCKLSSSNSEGKDVIYASIESGEEVDAGGIVGFAFNNFVAKECSVEIKNGNVIAEKRGMTDDTRSGTNVGGIIGRLDHTCEIYRCNVSSENMNIISRSPENYSSAGGIAGWDMGPYHREVISINGCSFDGGGTSRIILDISADDSKNIFNACGGIVGVGTYQLQDCTVKNVIFENHSENIQECYVGGICGILCKRSGFWTKNEYFTAGEAQIINCTSSEIAFDVSKNVYTNEFCTASR